VRGQPIPAPMVEAAEGGDIASLRGFLRERPSLVRGRTEIGDTLLHCAAAQGQPAACRLLLDGGADVNAVGNQGKRPLHYAARAGSLATAKVLLGHGAALDATDDRGQTPLVTAALSVEVGRPGTARVVAVLAQASGGLDLRSAVLLGEVRRVRAILKADPRAVAVHPDPGGLLVDAVTCQPDNVSLVRLLLEAGADPNRRPGSGSEALLGRVSNPEVADLLLSRRASLRAGKGPRTR
jgi:ankyrin repeat protein